MGAKRAPSSVLVGMKTLKGQSEKKCLLGRDEYGSNMHSAYYKDPPQRTLVTRTSPTDPWQERKRKMSKERLQLPH